MYLVLLIIYKSNVISIKMTLLTKSQEIETLCNNLKKEPFICVDTEFIREKYYYPKLCLIQIGDSKGNGWAIDPLINQINLSPIFELLLDKKILKVLHSPRQDFEIIFNILKKIPTPIFDTQSAAMCCGFGDSASYESLVKNISNINLDKSARYTNWENRPLNEKQIKYAISDVTYLSEIYLFLNNHMEKNKRINWIKEEIEKFNDLSLYKTESQNAWKRIKFNSSNNKTMSIFRQIAALREELAKSNNIPRNKIFRDDVIIKLTKNPPNNIKDFDNLRGMNLKHIDISYKNKILNYIKIGKNEKNIDWLNKRNINTPSKAITDILKIILLSSAEKHNISPLLIANKEDLKLIALGEKDVKALKGWRYDIFGSFALKLMEGKFSLKIKNGSVIID
ncbi:MAG: ribonuclease D [Alphaproteobacteria bacterium]|nr:MAG: ribonuclease D [Alphaproteobacteria bacterium]